ncbi:MAG: hypothetical protein WC954_04490 [Sphaerochaeta sp.]
MKEPVAYPISKVAYAGPKLYSPMAPMWKGRPPERPAPIPVTGSPAKRVVGPIRSTRSNKIHIRFIAILLKVKYEPTLNKLRFVL